MNIFRLLKPLKLSAKPSSIPASTNDRSAVDLDFYRSIYPDLQNHDDEAVMLHWERHGRIEGRFPNARVAIVDHPAFDNLPKNFHPISYVFLNRDLDKSFHNAVAATRHFLQFGFAEGRRYECRESDEDFLAEYRKLYAPTPKLDDPLFDWEPKNINQYLFLRGFDNCIFLQDFDHKFYADIAGLQIMPSERLPAIFHFADFGVLTFLPIAEHLLFEPHFVRRFAAQSIATSHHSSGNADLYRWWLSQDNFAAVPPNHTAWMKQRFGVSCISEDIIDLSTYRQANKDLCYLDDASLIEHVFSEGLFERRSSIKITSENLPTFLQYADRLEADGDLTKAEALYGTLDHFAINAPRLNQQFGDFLLRRGRAAEAFSHYRKNIDTAGAGRWSFLNAASSCERIADLGGALHALAAGRRAFREDEHIRRLWEEAADRFFAEERGFAEALAEAGKVQEAQARLYSAAARCDEKEEGSSRRREVRTIAIFANTDLPQCTLYRVEQKVEQLRAAGFTARVFDWHLDYYAYHRELADFDAVIFFRVAAFPKIIRAINAAKVAGLPTFYEVDDLIFDAASFPEPLRHYAGQITRKEHIELSLGVPLFRYAMQMCDYAIASTRTLAKEMEKQVRCGRAFVHRNGLGRRHKRAVDKYEAQPASTAQTVTIFYGSGTKAHKLDFEIIVLPALERLKGEFGKKVFFVIAGHRSLGMQSEALKDATFIPFTSDVEAYWAAASEADIVLSVLRRSATTDAKSEIKWVEGAMFGLPAVVSATATFLDVIEDGVDGFLAHDADDFYNRLVALVTDPDLRRSVGQAAKRKVMETYSVTNLAANLRDIFAHVSCAKSARLRLLIVNVFYPPHAKGGATRVVVDNIRDLRRLYPDEFEIEVFTTLDGAQDPYSTKVYLFEGVRVTAMATSHYPDIELAAMDDRAGACFRRSLERFSPDLIHFHCIQRISASVVEVARSLSIPYLITAHDGWWISDKQFLYSEDGLAPLYAFDQTLYLDVGEGKSSCSRPAYLLPALEGAEAILAVSETFSKIYKSVGLKKVVAISNGVPDLRHNEKDVLTSRLDRGDKVRIAHLGGLEPHKGFPMLKRAVLIARPKHISIVAVDLALEPGEERSDDCNGTPLRFMARHAQSEMRSLYEQIDVVFAPSLWPESFGLVSREAIAAGCWVVASDRGAIGEAVEENVNGHVVSVDDLSGLVAVLRRIDGDPARYRASPPKAAPARTSEDQAIDLAELYRSIVPASTRGRRLPAETE